MTNSGEHQNLEDRKEIVQDVIDRLLYCKGYREALAELNKNFVPPDLNRRLKNYRDGLETNSNGAGKE